MKKIYILFIFVVLLNSCIEITEDTTPRYVNEIINTETSEVIKSPEVNNAFGDSYIKIVGDSLYVFTKTPGILYPIYKTTVTDTLTHNEWGTEVWGDIKKITIEGDIDARDFNTIKWNFRNLVNLDISKTKIRTYSGLYGTTNLNQEYIYTENTIPICAFFYNTDTQIRELPDELFDEGMKSLETVKLPEGITYIGLNAFARAYNLKSINIPESVNVISQCAFRYCKSLESLTLPSMVNSVGFMCFTDMHSLKEFHSLSKEVPETGICAFGIWEDFTNYKMFGKDEPTVERGVVRLDNYLIYENATLYVPKGSKEKYMNNEIWSKFFKEIVEE